jgi:hypothetical protein
MYRGTEKAKAKILCIFLRYFQQQKRWINPNSRTSANRPLRTEILPPPTLLQLRNKKLFSKVYRSNTIFSETDGETQ